ncbi:alpha/beta fold hydrolase, partial [Streptomyces sp. 7G]|uniref:thioesterase II family protein n=1 Tax=Streptomyces sp. 7G TaxID=2877241 RepID=UPI001CD2ED75
MADVDTVLICLPFAGAGPSFFTPWQKLAPEGLRILPVSLPGREKRFPEPAYDAAAPAVDDAYAQVTAALGGADGDGGGSPVVLFGHSMGAVLAYELAHRIERAGGPLRLAALVVSGAPGPWTPRTDRADGLPDEEFAAGGGAFAGYDHPALADPEMRELLLPALRADVRLHETYVPSTDSPLSVPVISVRGREDTLVGA